MLDYFPNVSVFRIRISIASKSDLFFLKHLYKLMDWKNIWHVFIYCSYYHLGTQTVPSFSRRSPDLRLLIFMGEMTNSVISNLLSPSNCPGRSESWAEAMSGLSKKDRWNQVATSAVRECSDCWVVAMGVKDAHLVFLFPCYGLVKLVRNGFKI